MKRGSFYLYLSFEGAKVHFQVQRFKGHLQVSKGKGKGHLEVYKGQRKPHLTHYYHFRVYESSSPLHFPSIVSKIQKQGLNPIKTHLQPFKVTCVTLLGILLDYFVTFLGAL